MTRRNRDLLLVALGLIMTAAGLFLCLTEQQQEQLAGENAQLLMEAISQQQPAVPEAPAPEGDDGDGAAQSLTVMGYDVLGTLRIPSVDIDLPVLNSWSYDLLNVSPCRYSGSIETGDLVILGHSYRTHLRPLRQVHTGDAVELTDAAGTVHRYVVAETETLRGSDADALPSPYPLTIFTCTADSRHRFLARCTEA